MYKRQALKYRWGKIGKSHWFKCFPFVIVAINILIAVVSDFESAIRAWGTTWVSSEGVTLYGLSLIHISSSRSPASRR